MTHFIRSGNTYRVFAGSSLDVSDTLPGGNYVLQFNPMAGFSLEQAEPFRMPDRIYGNCLRYTDRIVNTFRSRPGNTGVLLTGDKGSGKTLLARQVAITSGLPTIIINTAFKGDEFNSFLSGITQPCIVMLDEFEKVYDRDDQEKILTLLDGTYQSKKLFLLTSNNKWRIDDNMRNRPGRIFYLMEFGGLDEKFIKEYCEENLSNQDWITKVVEVSRLFDVFNFDLLASIVEESNRYGEDPATLTDLLNAKPEYAGKSNYNVGLVINGTQVPAKAVNSRSVNVNTSVDEFTIYVNFACLPEHEPLLREEGVEVDWDAVLDAVKAGEMVPWKHGMSEDPLGADVEYETGYLDVTCTPFDVTKYGGANSIEYSPIPGITVILNKTNKKVTSRFDELY
jgi:hypothetical protein